MITGRSSGTGKYAFHSRSLGNQTVHVSNTPEDSYNFRIAFSHHGETHHPIIKIDKFTAEMLWAALNSMAKDMGWKDIE